MPFILDLTQSLIVSKPIVGKSARKSCFNFGILIKILLVFVILIFFNNCFVPFLFSVQKLQHL